MSETDKSGHRRYGTDQITHPRSPSRERFRILDPSDPDLAANKPVPALRLRGRADAASLGHEDLARAGRAGSTDAAAAVSAGRFQGGEA